MRFCPSHHVQYSCSCCSRQHVAHIYRLLLPALTDGSAPHAQPEAEPKGGQGKRSSTGAGAKGKPGKGGQGVAQGDSLGGGRDREGAVGREWCSEDEDGVSSVEWEGEAGLGVGGAEGEGAEAGMSAACLGMLNTMACRYCDPEVSFLLSHL